MAQNIYQNSTELMQLHGQSDYMKDMVDACLYGRLNLFLQGNTGDGKTQLAKDAMSYFGDNSLFVLGVGLIDIRKHYQRVSMGWIEHIPNNRMLWNVPIKGTIHPKGCICPLRAEA